MPVRFEKSTEEHRKLQLSRQVLADLEAAGGAVSGRGVRINGRKIGKKTRQFSVEGGGWRVTDPGSAEESSTFVRRVLLGLCEMREIYAMLCNVDVGGGGAASTDRRSV